MTESAKKDKELAGARQQLQFMVRTNFNDNLYNGMKNEVRVVTKHMQNFDPPTISKATLGIFNCVATQANRSMLAICTLKCICILHCLVRFCV